MQGFLRQFKIRARLWFLLALSALMILSLAFITVLNSHRLLQKEKSTKTRHLVEVASSALAFYHEQAEQGLITRQQAQNMAIAQIKAMRYEGSEYFWIHSMDAKMIMHPFKPKLDGQDLSNFKDPYGTPLFNRMIEVVKEKGAGFVPYYWPKPGLDEPVSKISYVQGFSPWGWIVGSGIYLDDVEAQFVQDLKVTGGVAAALILLLMAVATVIARSMTHPLEAVNRAMRNISSGEGNLRQRLDDKGRDEITDFCHQYNLFAGKLAQIITDLQHNIGQLDTVASGIAQASQQSEQEARAQKQESEHIVESISNMTDTIRGITNRAEHAAAAATNAGNSASEGKQIIDAAIQSSTHLADEMQTTNSVIEDLKHKVDSIGSVLDVIRAIAEQTNLLALNAAIEAARAGEQGRGFAVVADEVRTLASRTQESTEEIHAMISALQDGTLNMVKAIGRSKELSNNNVASANESGGTLTAIITSVDDITRMNQEIANAAEQQCQVSETIHQNVARLNQGVDRIVEISEHSSGISDSIQLLSKQMMALSKQFKVQ